jgi:hypothetical protein
VAQLHERYDDDDEEEEEDEEDEDDLLVVWNKSQNWIYRAIV